MSELTLSETPEWLTANFLRDLLQISCHVELTSVEYACKKGENFASKIYRVKYKSDSDADENTVIVKSRPFENNGFSEEFLKKFNVFEKEIETYKLVDAFENILSSSLKKNVILAPKCLKVTKKPTDILIIDDLCSKGYEVTKKSTLFGMEKMKIALKKLAQFHAASAIYYERNGVFDEKYSRGVYNTEMTDIFDQHFDPNFNFILEFLSTWPNVDNKIIEKMKNWRKFILNELIRSMSPAKDDDKNFNFNCLNHGDCWLSNILFINDENGNTSDCAFIDFQQCVFTSPAVDLLTLIITSVNTDIKLQYFDYFVKFYYENLVETLTILGYTDKKIPTLKAFYIDIIDRVMATKIHMKNGKLNQIPSI
ncbi:hypothetical protein PVAND_010838 [Polypedilum vanderplanki]|uniref:CHK kinase-like domain-containing protein n=1 Tax=Polypedilum vanderplanki TaxID=319348 RepID=A0A9J6CHH3_POLVA|nr:hypothetical protein PVAND_010838 [Polypedilum vanderplanki]